MNNTIYSARFCSFEEMDVLERYAVYDLEHTGEDWEFELTSSHQAARELNSLSMRAFHPTDR